MPGRATFRTTLALAVIAIICGAPEARSTAECRFDRTPVEVGAEARTLKGHLVAGRTAVKTAAVGQGWDGRLTTDRQAVKTASDGTAPDGRLTVRPDRGVAGEYGTWTVTYHVGDDGIEAGGGIRVQLPDAWHAGERNSAIRLQATDPAADHYVRARASRPDVQLQTSVEQESDALLVKSSRAGLDGRLERYVFVVRVTLEGGRLAPGDSLSVIYGDTSGGSRGMTASIVSTPPLPILAAVDHEGGGDFDLLDERPTILALAGPPSRLLVSGPSTQVVGRPSELRVAVVDRNWNPVPATDGSLLLRLATGSAEFPAETPMEAPAGYMTVPFTPNETGVLRFRASALGGLLEARGSPMQVFASEPPAGVYWGDLHSHSEFSWDGVGRNSFSYARHVSGLDFYALTDHSREPQAPSNGDSVHTRGLGEHVWGEYTAHVEEHYEPGLFVTLHAYEASFGAPWGHHNVYFRNRPGALLYPENVSLPDLWQALSAGQALTIPHHTGKFPSPLSWEPHNSELRRNFEIYSAHGLSESYDPSHPLAFEHSDFTAPSRSVDAPQYAQDAWASGLELSTVAASDDHRAQPGKPHWGLCAVSATDLTRDAVFDALYDRRTYATTGVRLLLDFSAGEIPMGGRGVVDDAPLLSLEVHASDAIEWVEILRRDEASDGFHVVYRIEPNAMDLTWSSVDSSLRGDAVYYVRLRQRADVEGRAAMAWSSPIWVERAGDE